MYLYDLIYHGRVDVADGAGLVAAILPELILLFGLPFNDALASSMTASRG